MMNRWHSKYRERKVSDKVWISYGYSLLAFRVGFHVSRLNFTVDLYPFYFGIEW